MAKDAKQKDVEKEKKATAQKEQPEAAKPKEQKEAKKATWKGKQWYQIISPQMFGAKSVGETPAGDPKQLVGRVMIVNAVNLTGNPTKYYFKIMIKVDNVDGTNATTQYFGHEVSRDFISRMVRRHAKRIDTRDVVTTKDGVRVVVKTVGITLKTTKTTIQGNLRKAVSAAVNDFVSNTTLEKFVSDVLTNKIQKDIVAKTNKVYPLRHFEIRRSEILE